MRASLGTFLDFLMRLVFFAAAPFALVFAAALFPVTGAMVQVVLALAVFFAGEAARGLAARSRIARVLLANLLEFEAYYRARRPRPFLYYVAYPLLFPYWLAVREARREFLLFKGYTILSFALMLGSLGYQYGTSYPPELSARDFLPIAAGTLAAEAVVVLMFLMPIVTTVVHFHALRAPRRLGALLLVGALSVGWAIVRLTRPRDPVVSFATRARVRMRTEAKPTAARDAQVRALREAWKALPRYKGDVDTDGKVTGLPLDRAHAGMAPFYKADEADAFDLWYQRSPKSAVVVVYFESRGGHAAIWLAMDGAGTAFHDAKRLPRGAFSAMKHAADAPE